MCQGNASGAFLGPQAWVLAREFFLRVAYQEKVVKREVDDSTIERPGFRGPVGGLDSIPKLGVVIG